MTTSARFIQLANEALTSGKLSEASVKGLRNLLDVRLNRHASREIDLFEEVQEVLKEPSRSLPCVPDSQVPLFNILYSIYSILHPDKPESNLRAATFDAIDNIKPSAEDLKEIFGKKVKYYSFDHLHHLLIYRANTDLMINDECTDILKFCADNIPDKKPHASLKRASEWRGADVWNHIYYHLNKNVK